MATTPSTSSTPSTPSPARRLGVYEVKAHLSRVLDEVARGEVVEITRHGRVIARLEPAGPATTPETDQAAERMAEVFREVRRKSKLKPDEMRSLIEEGRS